MDIELYAFLSSVILGSTILTMLFALFSYLAFRSRRRRAGRLALTASVARPTKALFFRRYEGS